MARIRTIKPEFWSSEQVVDCSPTSRLLFIGMWNFCDDGGNCPASYRGLKMQVFPGDDITAAEIESMVSELICAGLVVQYSHDGKNYWHVTGWHHQKIEKRAFKYPQLPTSRLPVDDDSPTSRLPVDDRSPPDVDVEGKGEDVERKGSSSSGQKNADEDDIPQAWKADADIRRIFAMTLDWVPTQETLKGYMAGKPITDDDIASRLTEWRESANASGQTMTDAQWTLRLVKFTAKCKTNPLPTENNIEKPQVICPPIGTLTLAPGHTLPPPIVKTEEGIRRGREQAAELRRKLNGQ